MSRGGVRHGLARVLSKRGICSRSEAARWIAAGRVSVDSRVVLDPEFPIIADSRARIRVDGRDIDEPQRVYLMLNKPRGLVTTASDERGRDTVYRCFEGANWRGAAMPWLAPVGRLDQASEGLLLFGNDPEWAARVTDPRSGPDKTYHVQIDAVPGEDLARALVQGVPCDGTVMRAKSVRILRAGARRGWLEIVLDEGRNRQIRRLLGALGVEVLRLVRVAIGELALADLPKGQWRALTPEEVARLGGGGEGSTAPGACRAS